MPNDTSLTKDDPKTFPGMLIAYKQQIAAALPKHINADRMARIALTAYRQNPKLARCEPASVFAAVILSSQQGLEIGLNGRAYIVPYENRKTGKLEAQYIPGWKGLVELANRTGRASVWTGAVFDGDSFDYQLGDNPYVTHKPENEDDPEKLTHVYSVGRIKGNDYPIIEVWSNAKVRKHFERYNKVGAMHYAHGNWEMYARKVPLLQVLKYLPSSPELETAIAASYAAESGSQALNIKDAVEGTFTTPPEGDNDGNGAGSGNATIDSINRGASNEAGKQEASKGPDVTPELIEAKLRSAHAANDLDILEAHATLIGEIKDEHRREATTKLYKMLRDELKAKR
jgi:recombination protein RecT